MAVKSRMCGASIEQCARRRFGKDDRERGKRDREEGADGSKGDMEAKSRICVSSFGASWDLPPFVVVTYYKYVQENVKAQPSGVPEYYYQCVDRKKKGSTVKVCPIRFITRW